MQTVGELARTKNTQRSIIPCRQAHHAKQDRLRDGPGYHTRLECRLVEKTVRLVVHELEIQVYQMERFLVVMELLQHGRSRKRGRTALSWDNSGRARQMPLLALVAC